MPNNLDLIKSVLLERIQETREALKDARARIETPYEASFWGSHSEAGSEDFQKQMIQAEIQRLSVFLEKAERAFIRLEKKEGDFGICRKCGKMIPLQRLLAVPITEHCATCKNGIKKIK